MDVLSLSEYAVALFFALGAGAVVLAMLERSSEPLCTALASRVAQSIELEARCKEGHPRPTQLGTWSRNAKKPRTDGA